MCRSARHFLCEIVCAKRYKLNSCLAIYECSHEECFFGLRIRTFDALATRVCDENQESYEEENVHVESKFSIRPIDQKKTFKRISIDSFHRLASETIEIREINEHRYLYTSRIRASIGLSSRMTGGYRPVDEFPLI